MHTNFQRIRNFYTHWSPFSRRNISESGQQIQISLDGIRITRVHCHFWLFTAFGTGFNITMFAVNWVHSSSHANRMPLAMRCNPIFRFFIVKWNDRENCYIFARDINIRKSNAANHKRVAHIVCAFVIVLSDGKYNSVKNHFVICDWFHLANEQSIIQLAKRLHQILSTKISLQLRSEWLLVCSNFAQTCNFIKSF